MDLEKELSIENDNVRILFLLSMAMPPILMGAEKIAVADVTPLFWAGTMVFVVGMGATAIILGACSKKKVE